MPEYVIFCDKADDEELAAHVFKRGPLADAAVTRLPARSHAPAPVREFLEWERADWLITRDDQLVAAAELSRHGYTGDNGFQRFARLERASALGVPCVYFTPFSRTRNNELLSGSRNHRNVSPEMFNALLQASEMRGIPSIALRWPTDPNGTPFPLGTPATRLAESSLAGIMTSWATRAAVEDLDAMWEAIPGEVVEEMHQQAALAYRGSETRGLQRTPFNPTRLDWLWDFIPSSYFSYGKADKVLAYAALRSAAKRNFIHEPPSDQPWDRPGKARILYLGYQWRPDPTCGLIAYSGVLSRAERVPHVVVWPRVFHNPRGVRLELLQALDEFASSATGPLVDYGQELGLSPEALQRLSTRVSADARQFGVYQEGSKVGRILAANADLLVLGDSLYVP